MKAIHAGLLAVAALLSGPSVADTVQLVMDGKITQAKQVIKTVVSFKDCMFLDEATKGGEVVYCDKSERLTTVHRGHSGGTLISVRRIGKDKIEYSHTRWGSFVGQFAIGQNGIISATILD